MQKKPVIGISVDLTKNIAKYKYSAFPWYTLRQNYANSVITAGGVPIMIPYQHESIAHVLNLIDGLIIPGNASDINPRFYGQPIHSKTVTTNDERTEFELKLLKMAIERNIPYLGICNGMQVLNVALGGDLIQHIPDLIKTNINHAQRAPKNVTTHSVTIKPGTILASLAGSIEETVVNSTHHQAIGKVGEGLIISATAPDGVIEAIESPKHKFLIGVEWHPEYLNENGVDLGLFKGLVERARHS
jgi:putative glutamine amidotransferase